MTIERDGPPGMGAQGTVDVREFMAKVLRHKRLVVVIVAAVVTLVMVYSYLRPRVYSSTAEVLVSPILVQPLSTGNPLDQLIMPTEKELVTSADVANIARTTLGGTMSLKDLIDRVSVDNPTGTQILDISYVAGDPGAAQHGAQAFADAYLSWKSQQAIAKVSSTSDTIRTQISEYDGQILSLDKRIPTVDPNSPEYQSLTHQRDSLDTARLTLQSQLASVATLNVDPGHVIQPAQRVGKPVSPKHKLDLALGLLLGLAIAFLVAYMRETRRDRIQAPQVVGGDLEAPVLGLIPDARRLRIGAHPLVAIDDPHGLPAEAYRTLRTNLLAVCRDANARSVLVTSARQGEGKTTTTANLAVALSQAGRSVLLVSADFRSPRIHTFFGSANERGLGQVLMGKLPLKDAIVATEMHDLDFLPSGPVASIDEPVELLHSDGMNEVLGGSDRWDFILVDSPPIFPVADSLVLADLVDGVLFVTDVQSSTEASVGQSRRQITQVGGRILGGTLNRVPSSWSIDGYGSDSAWRGLVDRYVLHEAPSSEDLPGKTGSRVGG